MAKKSNIRHDKDARLYVLFCENITVPNDLPESRGFVSHWYCGGAHRASESFELLKEAPIEFCSFLVADAGAEVDLQFTIATESGEHVGVHFSKLGQLASSEQFQGQLVELKNAEGVFAHASLHTAAQMRWCRIDSPAYQKGTVKFVEPAEDPHAQHIWQYLFPNKALPPPDPGAAQAEAKRKEEEAAKQKKVEEEAKAKKAAAAAERRRKETEEKKRKEEDEKKRKEAEERKRKEEEEDRRRKQEEEEHRQRREQEEAEEEERKRKEDEEAKERQQQEERRQKEEEHRRREKEEDERRRKEAEAEEEAERQRKDAEAQAAAAEKRRKEEEQAERIARQNADEREREAAAVRHRAEADAAASRRAESRAEKGAPQGKNESDEHSEKGARARAASCSSTREKWWEDRRREERVFHLNSEVQAEQQRGKAVKEAQRRHEQSLMFGVESVDELPFSEDELPFSPFQDYAVKRHPYAGAEEAVGFSLAQRGNREIPNASQSLGLNRSHRTPLKYHEKKSRVPNAIGHARAMVRSGLQYTQNHSFNHSFSHSPNHGVSLEHSSNFEAPGDPNTVTTACEGQPTRIFTNDVLGTAAADHEDVKADGNIKMFDYTNSSDYESFKPSIHFSSDPAINTNSPGYQADYRTHFTTEAVRFGSPNVRTTYPEVIKSQSLPQSAIQNRFPHARQSLPYAAGDIGNASLSHRRLYRVLTRAIAVRRGADVSSERTGDILTRGTVFEVSVAVAGSDGRTYLKLAGASGWVFDDSRLDPNDPSVEQVLENGFDSLPHPEALAPLPPMIRSISPSRSALPIAPLSQITGGNDSATRPLQLPLPWIAEPTDGSTLADTPAHLSGAVASHITPGSSSSVVASQFVDHTSQSRTAPRQHSSNGSSVVHRPPAAVRLPSPPSMTPLARLDRIPPVPSRSMPADYSFGKDMALPPWPPVDYISDPWAMRHRNLSQGAYRNTSRPGGTQSHLDLSTHFNDVLSGRVGHLAPRRAVSTTDSYLYGYAES